MLTNEQTFDLLNQAKNGNDLAKEKLITLNSPLIKSVVKRYLNKGIEYDDMMLGVSMPRNKKLANIRGLN